MPSAEAVPGGVPDDGVLYLFGPVLRVLIGFDIDPREPGAPTMPVFRCPALVDTGATDSSIDSALATRLGLRVIDEKHVSTTGGSETFNVYSGRLEVSELNFVKCGPLLGANLSGGHQPYGALLGRDFLRHCSMHYDGPTGSVKISKKSH